MPTCRSRLTELGLDTPINPMPCEIADCVPFDEDTAHKSYDAEAVQPLLRARCIARQPCALAFPLRLSRQGEPGAFLLGLVRSGGDALFRAARRRAIPAAFRICPNAVAQEAYSHEVSSAGFWPGSPGPVDYPAFYSYAYPAPAGFAAAKVKPADAFFAKELGEFILPYDAVRNARDPRRGADGVPAERPTTRRPIWRNGTARIWNARSASRAR